MLSSTRGPHFDNGFHNRVILLSMRIPYNNGNNNIVLSSRELNFNAHDYYQCFYIASDYTT